MATPKRALTEAGTRPVQSSAGANTCSSAGSSDQIQRDLRVARALRIRRAHIHDEMEVALRLRTEAYCLADECLDEFDHLAKTDKVLGTVLMALETKLARASAYFVGPEQTDKLRETIDEVGADIRRFCKFMRVDGIAQIPAHRFEFAMNALQAKRARAAA